MIRIIGKTAARKICFDATVASRHAANDTLYGINVIVCTKCHLHNDLKSIVLENFAQVEAHVAEHRETINEIEAAKVKTWLDGK